MGDSDRVVVLAPCGRGDGGSSSSSSNNNNNNNSGIDGRRRSTIEVHANFSEASSSLEELHTPHPKTDVSKKSDRIPMNIPMVKVY